MKFNPIKWLKKRSALFWEGPQGEGYPVPGRDPFPMRGEYSNDSALTVSAFFHALRLYQTTIGKLPLVVYEELPDGSRQRAVKHPAYNLLHDRPNNAMSRNAYYQRIVRDIFLEGEHFSQIQRAGNGRILNYFPIRWENVLQVWVDDDWRKAYRINTGNGIETFTDDEIAHCVYLSRDGIRGQRLLEYACEAMGIHKQVMNTAHGFYKNAARPSGYVKYPGKLTPEALSELKRDFKDDYQGGHNTGKIPVLQHDGDFKQFNDITAEDAKIIEALNLSVNDIAGWWGLDPMLLGDKQSATYNNLGAANQAFYQRSISPLLDCIELEFTHKSFGTSGYYAEFLVEKLTHGDPVQSSTVYSQGILNGYILRSEARQWMNLPPVEGLDVPLYPVNMGFQQPGTTNITATGGPANEKKETLAPAE